MIRPIVGFGHSMGGNVIVNLALLHPRLLSTVVAVEPVINTSAHEMNFIGTYSLTFREDKWPSKDAAMKSIAKSPFFAKWKPRVLDLFRQHGLRDTSAGDATLVTTKHQEVLSFARAAFPASRSASLADFTPDRVRHADLGDDRHPGNAFYRPESTMTFQQLPFLRPSCLYIYGKRSHMSAANDKGRKDKLRHTGTATGGSGGAAAGRVQDVVVEGSHFAPFEQPEQIASLVSNWLDREMTAWRDEQAAENDAWQAVPLARRSTVSDDWIYWVLKLWGKKYVAQSKL
jgi:pimeloyl-ACP methyl ester carboxylesterase